MKLEIVEKRENKLLNREEIKLDVVFDNSPPTRLELLNTLSDTFKVPKERIVIVKMLARFGIKLLNVHCHLYKSVEDLKKYENKYIIKRMEKVLAG